MFPKDTTVTSFTRISEAKDHYPKCRFIPQLTVYGDGSIDVTQGYIKPSKVPYFRAFRAFDRQRWHPDQTVKIALSEHINRSGRRVE